MTAAGAVATTLGKRQARRTPTNPRLYRPLRARAPAYKSEDAPLQQGARQIQPPQVQRAFADPHPARRRPSRVSKRGGADLRRCRETTELHAACGLRRGVRRPAPATVYHAHILYPNNMLNSTFWRNEANSSESSGFPRFSADFFPTVLIFLVDFERRQAPQRPPLPLDLTAAPFHRSKSPQRRSQLAITTSEMDAVISPRLLSRRGKSIASPSAVIASGARNDG